MVSVRYPHDARHSARQQGIDEEGRVFPQRVTIWMETQLKMAARGVFQVLILKYRGKSTLKGKGEFLEEVTDKWGPRG